MAVLLVNDLSLYEYRGPFDVAKIYLAIGNVERAYALYSDVKKKAPQYIDDVSTENGVQWNDVFEQAYDDYKNSPLTLHDTRIKDLKLLVYRSVLDGKPREGSADEAELNYLAGLAQQPGVKRIAEIGFNAGMSSYAFLYANPDATVVSFDLGEYDYGPPAKDIIDEEFPGRHELIFGDSTKTVLEYHAAHPEEKFDLIFIDGGHDYETARADIRNMRKLAAENAIVVTDDLTPWLAWGEGPHRAWTEAIEWGVIEQDEIVKDGEVVDEIHPPGDRIYARGRYAK
ncbi:class I SAM-dependent methyltransferase [Candidatus Saccharibacteria bacterium]|nr:class I SAM-dependent methyltransferase [Candidatus Saccharibacteria bacterium]